MPTSRPAFRLAGLRLRAIVPVAIVALALGGGTAGYTGLGTVAGGTWQIVGVGNVAIDVARILARGNKIEAIKLAREKYGLGLKEAKDYVERMPDLR